MDAEYLRELFSSFGAVRVRRMFGGAGLYASDIMFALAFDGQIYLKADASTAPAYEREKSAPFEYTTKTGKRAVMSYWRLPDRLYDDPDELAQWAMQAIAAARREAARKSTGQAKELKTGRR